ncbi:MAG: dihydromonapterin reductase [Gammaproteobacteria bacterium]|nr:dihydromonapterin reductase [Gammaproteobacteria bacterium]MDH3536791.1 dihydromonapterin reductase [Gammaproteobacteria bacterium]
MTDVVSPVVITGGAQRLGLAVALALKAENYPVVISYRKLRPLLEQLEQKGIITIQADFSTSDGALLFAKQLRARYRSLRAIIHNASEWMQEGDDQPDAVVMERMLNVHVTAPYLLNQECGDLLRRHGELRGHADIIHMSDYVAGTGSKKHIAYAASKAALDNLTLSFASKYAPLVKVNSIAPALLMFNQEDDAAYREKALKKSLLGIAPGETEGVNAIRYILESRYLTGKTIGLDGGRHLAQAS